MGSNKIDVMRRMYVKYNFETNPENRIWQGPGCYSYVSLAEINVLINKTSIWWVCIFQKILFHKKIPNRTTGNRVAEKEDEVSSSTIYWSVPHILYYYAVASQFNLFFVCWTTDFSQIAREQI